jgi:hypothetical protein
MASVIAGGVDGWMYGCDVGQRERELESLACFCQVQRNYFPELESDR